MKGQAGGWGIPEDVEDSATYPFPLQDLAWMLSFYARIFFTYMPLLGLKGFLGLFFIVRYGHVVGCRGWLGKYR